MMRSVFSSNQPAWAPLSHSAWHVYGRLLQGIWRYKGSFLLGMGATLAAGLLDAGLIWFVKPLIDHGLVGKNMLLIRWLPVVVMGAFVLRGGLGFVSLYLMGRAGWSTMSDYRYAIFAQFLALPVHTLNAKASGKWLSLMVYNVDQLSKTVTDTLFTLLKEATVLVGVVLVMLSISVSLSLLFFSVLPLLAWRLYQVSQRMRRLGKAVQHTMGGVTHKTEEGLKGYAVIRTLGGQAFSLRNMQVAIASHRAMALKVVCTQAINSAVMQCVLAGAAGLAIWWATQPYAGVSPGGFIAMVVSMLRLPQPMRRLTQVHAQIQQGIAHAMPIFELLDQEKEVDTGKNKLKKARGSIVFERVSFAYPAQKTVLTDVSFAIEPGQMVGIVGASGAGKSTLVHLLPRFYTVDTGRILLDGQDIQGYRLCDLRRQFAFVSQETVLFQDTIANNIAFNLAAVDRGVIEEAAQAAHAMEFIRTLPDGLDTHLGEHGVQLSGGQRQRIAIARAWLRQAPIVIFDEATSALDAHAEQAVNAALDQLRGKSTVCVIAHKLTTIRRADTILVLAQGRLCEQGTHASLMQQQGVYYHLYQRAQSAAMG